MAYQNVPSEAYWPEQPADPGFTPTRTKSSKKKWGIIAGVILGVAVVAGIVAGVVVSQVHKNKSDGSSSSSGSSSGNSTATLSDPSDPSNFTMDAALHQSFWGFAYTPQVSRT
jgi:hypothetical protein